MLPGGIQEMVNFQEREQKTSEEFRSAGRRFWLYMEAVAVIDLAQKARWVKH